MGGYWEESREGDDDYDSCMVALHCIVCLYKESMAWGIVVSIGLGHGMACLRRVGWEMGAMYIPCYRICWRVVILGVWICV
jgi:hypothetical protein